MTRFTSVPSLRLVAASGTTLYPGESGFSSVWGEVESDTLSLDGALDRMVSTGSVATLRCGALEVTGLLQLNTDSGDRRYYKIAVESVRYGAPDHAA